MNNRRLFKILEQYANIYMGSKHLIANPHNTTIEIAISLTPHDIDGRKYQVFKDFRKHGIIIKELKPY